MKKLFLLAMLAVLALSLTACATNNAPAGDFQVATQKPVGAVVQQTEVPTAEPADEPEETDWDNAEYDPASEDTAPDVAAQVEATYYPYAGATPMPLDPLDKPTATPRVPIAFTAYQTYDAAKLGLAFEGPTGWLVDDSEENSYTITDPVERDGYQAFLNITVQDVSRAYDTAALKAEVKAMLSSISSKNYTAWKPSSVDSRKLMGIQGVYANYAGTLANGVRVRGRITAISTDSKVILVHLSDPAAFNSDYLDGVYKKLETTLAETR